MLAEAPMAQGGQRAAGGRPQRYDCGPVVGGDAGLRQGGRAAVDGVHCQAGVAQSLRDLAGQRDVVFGHRRPPGTIARLRT